MQFSWHGRWGHPYQGIFWHCRDVLPLEQKCWSIDHLTSVLTIYKLKGTNDISWPHPSSWCHYQTFVACVPLSTKYFVNVLYSEPRQFKWFKWLLKICWFWGGAKGHIVSFVAGPKGTLEPPPPQGTVPFGEGLARTLHLTCILLIGTLAIFLSPCTHSCLPQVQRLPMWWLCNAVKLVTICVLVINNQHMFRTIWEFVQSRDYAAHLEIA